MKTVALSKAGVAVRTFLLCAVLVVAPLPRGSVAEWAWSTIAVVIGMALLVQAVTLSLRETRSLANLRGLILPASLLALVAGWIVVQITGWETPPQWRQPLAEIVASQFAVSPPLSIVLDRDRAWAVLLKLLLYSGTFLLAAQVAVSARQAKVIMATIVVSASMLTIGAIVWEMVQRSGMLTGGPSGFMGLTATFFNRNHYATFAGIAGLVALAVVFPEQRSPGRAGRGAPSWSHQLRRMLGAEGLSLAAFVVLSLGVVMSWSRAGTFCYGLAVIFLVSQLTSGRMRWFALGGLGLAVVALSATQAGIDIMDRFVLLKQYNRGREALATMAIEGIGLRPLAGWGAGSFKSLYYVFQPVDVEGLYSEVHNTYLELAFELGVPAALALFLAVGLIVRRCMAGIGERSRNRHFPAAASACAVFVGVHALFDFSAQIPAVALALAAVFGVGWAQSWSERRT